ncbi:hypothetical protein LDHU3_35.4750:CDS1 [Leishmania donovani]|nr:hypothetical protein LDHU3_35.4750:CDS1 [Leishmania donovani]
MRTSCTTRMGTAEILHPETFRCRRGKSDPSLSGSRGPLTLPRSCARSLSLG